MLFSSLLTLLSLLSPLLADASPAPLHKRNSSCAPSGFVQAEGSKFVLDGKPFYFAGANSYWITQLKAESDVVLTLSSMKDIGIKVLRIWGFGIVEAVPEDEDLAYYQLFNPNGTITYNFGENGIPRLDRVVKLAEEYGIRLVWTLVNNWVGYGGMEDYIALLAPNATNIYHDTFYSDQKIQKAYQEYVKFIVERYKNSSTVFAWELANEPRCIGNLPASSACGPALITEWIKTTSEYIKSLDPHHMVTLGDEGFFDWAGSNITSNYLYDGSAGINWDGNLQIDSIDYGTFHMYPQSWLTGSPLASDIGIWGAQWIREHAFGQYAYNKPVVLEEFGVTGYANKSLIYPLWYDEAFLGNLGGVMPWQWGQGGLSQNGTVKYSDVIEDGFSPNDGYAVYPNDTIPWDLLVNAAKHQNAKSG